MTQPRVATSVAGLIELLVGIAHIDGESAGHRRRAALPGRGIRDVVWSATFSDDADAVEAARWIVWEASQQLGAPSASIHELYMARGRGEVQRLHGPGHQPADAGLRHGAGHLPGGAVAELRARSSSSLLAASRSTPSSDPAEYITSVLAGAIAADWHGPGLHPGRPLPVQRQEVRDRSRCGRPRALQQGHRGRAGRRLRQHRHRLLDPGRPVARQRGRAAARRTISARPSCRRVIRENQPDGLMVSIGGEIGEVGKENSHRGGAARLSRRLPPRAGALAGAGRHRHSPRSASRRVPHTAACRCRTAAWPRSSWTSGRSSGCRRGVPQLRAGGRGPARRVDAAGRAVPPVPAGRDGRDPSRHGLPERALRPPRVPRRADRRRSMLVLRERCRRAQARARPTSSSCTRRRKKALGPQKRALWELPTKDEILAVSRRTSSYLAQQLGVSGSRAMVEKYVTAPVRHRPVPASLKG